MSIYGQGYNIERAVYPIPDIIGLSEESFGTIDEFPQESKTKIYVYEAEGDNHPHFHIVGIDGFNCAVCIYENKYFIHGHAKDTLNSQQRKFLCEILDKPYKDFGVSLWHVICTTWDDYRGSNLYKGKKSKRPDYRNMYESVH